MYIPEKMVPMSYALTPTGEPPASRDEHNATVFLENRGRGWAVSVGIQGGLTYSRKKQRLEPEPFPSNRDEAFFEDQRFDLDEATKIAKELFVEGVVVNGHWFVPANYPNTKGAPA